MCCGRSSPRLLQTLLLTTSPYLHKALALAILIIAYLQAGLRLARELTAISGTPAPSAASNQEQVANRTRDSENIRGLPFVHVVSKYTLGRHAPKCKAGVYRPSVSIDMSIVAL